MTAKKAPSNSASVAVLEAMDRAAEFPPLREPVASQWVFALRNPLDPKRQRDAALDMLACVAVHLRRGWTIPSVVTDWLCERLTEIAYLEVAPAAALRLAPPVGRPVNQHEKLNRAAFMHALIAWSVSKAKAAEVVADYFRVAEATDLVKGYNKLCKVWKPQHPNLNDRDPNELEWRATAKQFLSGREVWVSVQGLGPRYIPGIGFRLVEEFRDHVKKSGLISHID